MIQCVCLAHPQSADLLARSAFNTKYAQCFRIACGTTRPKGVDYLESNDFFPTYASWNSVLFETSVILTIWEHADQLIGDNDVAFIHSDVKMHFKPRETWKKISDWLVENPKRAIGLTAPSSWIGYWDGWEIPDEFPMRPANDPFMRHSFDNRVHVWEFIKRYIPDLYHWGMDTQPKMIYSHQFACVRSTFDALGDFLYGVAHRLRLEDAGFWTPHMFERLIALFLARYGGEPILSTAFWHYASSAVAGPGELSLYGPRPIKFCRVCTRANMIPHSIRGYG